MRRLLVVESKDDEKIEAFLGRENASFDGRSGQIEPPDCTKPHESTTARDHGPVKQSLLSHSNIDHTFPIPFHPSLAIFMPISCLLLSVKYWPNMTCAWEIVHYLEQ